MNLNNLVKKLHKTELSVLKDICSKLEAGEIHEDAKNFIFESAYRTLINNQYTDNELMLKLGYHKYIEYLQEAGK